jgi:hypothetical protein
MATGFLSGTVGVTLSAAAATGISAGIGVFGSSLLAGDGFKNSLRNGLTAGALTYGTAGLMGDFSTPATGEQSVGFLIKQWTFSLPVLVRQRAKKLQNVHLKRL